MLYLNPSSSVRIDPKDFIYGLYVHHRGTPEQKLNLIFDSLDTENQGVVEEQALAIAIR